MLKPAGVVSAGGSCLWTEVLPGHLPSSLNSPASCVLASQRSSPQEPRHVIPRPDMASDLPSLSRASWHISWYESGCYHCQSRQVPWPEQTKKVTVLSLCELVLCDNNRPKKQLRLVYRAREFTGVTHRSVDEGNPSSFQEHR